jgi:hypothetical protein
MKKNTAECLYREKIIKLEVMFVATVVGGEERAATQTIERDMTSFSSQRTKYAHIKHLLTVHH